MTSLHSAPSLRARSLVWSARFRGEPSPGFDFRVTAEFGKWLPGGMVMTRRDFLWSGAAAAALLAGTAAMLRMGGTHDAMAAETFEVTKTDAEWHAILSDAAYNVLRKEGTEYPGTS